MCELNFELVHVKSELSQHCKGGDSLVIREKPCPSLRS